MIKMRKAKPPAKNPRYKLRPRPLVDKFLRWMAEIQVDFDTLKHSKQLIRLAVDRWGLHLMAEEANTVEQARTRVRGVLRSLKASRPPGRPRGSRNT